MKHRLLLTLAVALAAISSLAASTRYAGADISLLPEYEEAGALYLDYNGAPIQGSALDYFVSQGLEMMRIRLFVNPANYNGPDKDPNACQSLDYIIPICKRIKDAGVPLMLDFHYSDTWADPAKQWTPTDWVGLNDEQLYQKIYDYTRETLETLAAEGVKPDFIQTGNEISYGMLWGAWNAPASSLKKCYSNSDANWPRFIKLLKQAGKACREVCPDAAIVLHTERVPNIPVLRNFYNRMREGEVDYDIIGLSYYPYFHGPLSNLKAALDNMVANFPDKQIMLVEAGYPYKWEVPGTTYDYSSVYPYSDAGQHAFTAALVDMAKSYANVTAIIWWWAEYNAYRTNLSGWYNAPLFDSLNGRACTALQALALFGDKAGVEAVTADPAGDDGLGPWYNLMGQPVTDTAAPGLYFRNGRKLLVK
ncbi:MAG: arabinogalactan endo-1,4-beta-galactosidase [Muribaculaceae bacterium]|nr:arabinogalactan endo-1,4-beta-galactosidase [Muribaculaceae bacterium]